MAITIGQVTAAINTVVSLQTSLSNLGSLLNQAKNLAANGWLIDIGSGSPITIAVPVSAQSALVAQYDSLKAQLVTTFGQLP